MLQRITDLWPSLLQGDPNAIADEVEGSEGEPGPIADDEVPIEEAFKGLRWTRVIDLRDYKETSMTTYKMVDDILECKEEIEDI